MNEKELSTMNDETVSFKSFSISLAINYLTLSCELKKKSTNQTALIESSFEIK